MFMVLHGVAAWQVAITLMGLSCAYGTLGFAEMQRQLLDRALTIKRRRRG